MWPAMGLVQHQKTSPQEAGQDHQRGTLWTHTSVQTPCPTASKGLSRGLRHGCAVVLACTSPPPLHPSSSFIVTLQHANNQPAGSGLCVHYSINWNQKIFPAENVEYSAFPRTKSFHTSHWTGWWAVRKRMPQQSRQKHKANRRNELEWSAVSPF